MRKEEFTNYLDSLNSAGNYAHELLERAGKEPCSFVCEVDNTGFVKKAYISYVARIENGTRYVASLDASHMELRDAAMRFWGYAYAMKHFL